MKPSAEAKKPAAQSLGTQSPDAVLSKPSPSSPAAASEAGRKPPGESRDSVLNRSSATVVLAENDPQQLNPDVVRSSGGSSWDDVTELETGRTRSLLMHWKSTEEDAAQPKTSTTRYSVLVVNANLCSKTNKSYTCYINFHGFFMPKNAFAAVAAARIPITKLSVLHQTLELMENLLPKKSTLRSWPTASILGHQSALFSFHELKVKVTEKLLFQ